jgi:hypothetical protein
MGHALLYSISVVGPYNGLCTPRARVTGEICAGPPTLKPRPQGRRLGTSMRHWLPLGITGVRNHASLHRNKSDANQYPLVRTLWITPKVRWMS